MIKSKLQKLPESSKDYHNPYFITQILYSLIYLSKGIKDQWHHRYLYQQKQQMKQQTRAPEENMSYHIKHVLLLALTLMAMHQSPVAESLTLAIGSVFVFNQVQGTLNIHCLSGYKDFGQRTLPSFDVLAWNVSIVIGKTEVYSCNMSSGNLHGRFDLFDSRTDWNSERCGIKNFDCSWKVAEDGVFLFSAEKGDYVAHYPWSKWFRKW